MISTTSSEFVRCAGLAVVLFALVAGCQGGPTLVDVAGKVTNNGAPLKVSSQGNIQIIFYPHPEVKEGKPFRSHLAQVNKENGTFAVKALPVGQYLITVKQIDPMPSNDVLEGAFDRKNSRIVREVTGNEPIIIELSKEAPAN